MALPTAKGFASVVHCCYLRMVHGPGSAHNTTQNSAQTYMATTQHNNTCSLLGSCSRGLFQPCLSPAPWRDVTCPLEMLGAQEAWLGNPPGMCTTSNSSASSVHSTMFKDM